MFKIYLMMLLTSGDVINVQSNTTYDSLESCNAEMVMVLDAIELEATELGIQAFAAECLDINETTT